MGMVPLLLGAFLARMRDISDYSLGIDQKSLMNRMRNCNNDYHMLIDTNGILGGGCRAPIIFEFDRACLNVFSNPVKIVAAMK